VSSPRFRFSKRTSGWRARYLEQFLVSVDADHLGTEPMEPRGNLAHTTTEVEHSLTSPRHRDCRSY
jgi:hypothetical protein